MTQRAFYPSLIFYKLKKESTTSWSNKRTKTLYQDYLYCIGNFSAVFTKETISNEQHQTSKTKFKVHMKVLSKLLLKWNWWWNFTCVCTMSLKFEIYFLSFTWEIVFDVVWSQTLMFISSASLENAKRIVNIRKLIRVPDFVH